jgi:hypothetical protein
MLFILHDPFEALADSSSAHSDGKSVQQEHHSHSHSQSDPHSHRRTRHRYHKKRHHKEKKGKEEGEKEEEVWTVATADPRLYTGATARPFPNEMSLDQLPAAFSWCRTPEGRSFCGASWNQHIPQSVEI